MCHAAFMHSILAVSMSMQDSAMKSWIICFSASSEPCEYRDSARSHIMSNARRAWPTQRIA